MGAKIASETLNQVVEILKRGVDMTIATVRPDGFPQATTVSYVNDGTNVYFGCDSRSQKAQNIARCNMVSLTVNLPYATWDKIFGLSLGGIAERMTDGEEILRMKKLMFEKFPQATKYAAPEGAELALFKITPRAISILDYSKGFGHTDLVAC